MSAAAGAAAGAAAPLQEAAAVVGLRHGQKNIALTVIVLEQLGSVKTGAKDDSLQPQQGVTTWLVADASGSINFSVFDDKGAHGIRPGDILRIDGGFVCFLLFIYFCY